MAYFSDYTSGEDAEEAFQRLREQVMTECRNDEVDSEDGFDLDDDFDESDWLANHYDCGNIAAKTGFHIVRDLDDAVEMPDAIRLAHQLAADTNGRFGEFADAGAIAVRGAQLTRTITFDRTGTMPCTGEIDRWREAVASAVVAQQFPGETVEHVLSDWVSVRDTHDRAVRGEMDVITVGSPGHTGWLFFGNATT